MDLSNQLRGDDEAHNNVRQRGVTMRPAHPRRNMHQMCLCSLPSAHVLKAFSISRVHPGQVCFSNSALRTMLSAPQPASCGVGVGLMGSGGRCWGWDWGDQG